MHDCFILGAGFSRAAAGSAMMPLMSDLLDPIVPGFIAELQGYNHLLIDGKAPIPDVEVWLSSLAEPQPLRERGENLQTQALFLEIVRKLANDLRRRTNEILSKSAAPPQWFASLMREWHKREARIITFNYDTLIESTLPALELIMPDGGTQEKLSYHRLPPGLIEHWAIMYAGNRLLPTKSFHLLKLHGSLNWYWDSAGTRSPIDIGIEERWGKDHPPGETVIRYRAPGLDPFLVPPTTAKSPFFGQAILREVWRQARIALQSASKIYALGYSFPMTDLSLRAMLSNCIRGKDVVVVDLSECPAESLRKLVPDVRIDKTFCGGDNPIERFVASYSV